MVRSAKVFAASLILASAGGATAKDLYVPGGWSAMASDRQAGGIGDAITVLVYETSSGVNSSQNSSKRNSQVGGNASAGSSFNQSAQLGLGSGFDANAQTGRSGAMVAQISVTVDQVLPNGDFHVSGEQALNINGEHTKIRIKGRVRRVDISNANTVLSSRLADAYIDYDGAGFVSRSARPSVLNRVFNWLGL